MRSVVRTPWNHSGSLSATSADSARKAAALAAVLEFGKIDAIGHSCIVALLLAIAADDRVDTVAVRQIVWTPVGYAASLAVVLLGYYELHSTLFGTSLV